MTIKTVPVTPFPDQRPGTSGLRKKVSVFRAPGYLPAFVQSIFDALPEAVGESATGKTLVLGGDGRFFNDEALQIILRIMTANGVGRIVVGRDGLLSTPAASAIIRKYRAFGGIILSASHNPGGPDGDFGVKYNIANGGPAPERVTEAIFRHTRRIAAYRTVEAAPVPLDRISTTRLGSLAIEVIDPVCDYAELMERIFDFDRIRDLFRSGFRLRFDAMHAVTGPYAVEILEGRLGAAPGTAVNAEPKPDFGGQHPDPNPTHAADLIDAEDAQAEVEERHARLYGAIAVEAGDRLGGADAHDWTDLVAEEMDNLRSALDWAIANDRQLAMEMCASLAGYWDFRGDLYEGRRWLGRALEGDATPTADRAAALAAAGSLAFRQADYTSARRLFEDSLTIAQSVASRAISARALAGLGDVLNVTDDPGGAAERYRTSLDLYRAEGDRLSVARGLSRLAGVANVRRDFLAAEELAQQSLEQFRLLGDQIGIANQLFTIGAVRLSMKKYASARDYFLHSLELRREIGDTIGTAYSCIWLAASEILGGNLVAACEPLVIGLKGCETAGDLRGLSMGLDMTFGLLVKAGSPSTGVRIEAAADNIRAVGGFLGMPPFQPILDGWITDSKQGLSRREAEYEDTVGRSMTRESALQFAIEQIKGIKDRLGSKERVSLTARENAIAILVAEGLSNRAIGERIHVSERTVDSHVQHVLNKLGFRSRTQIAAWHAGRAAPPAPRTGNRFVTTILVVDLAGSTSKVAQIGDAAWRSLLDQHYDRLRAELQKHEGVEIDTAGDGMMATFDGPASAIRCAWAIQRADRALGLASRAGIHSGEVERAGSAIRGIAVHIAARLASLGLADEVIVSGTTRDLAGGSGIRFESRGKKRLKGVPDPWSVFAAVG